MTVRSEIGPFTIVPEWVLDSDLSDRAVRLYALLGRYADDEGKAFPSRRTLAKRLKCSVDSVDRAVRELTESSILLVEHRYEEGDETHRQTSNTYALVQVPGRTGAAGEGGTDAAPPGRTGAAPGTRTSKELEPVEVSAALAVTARTITSDYVDGVRALGAEPPRSVVGQVARRVKSLLDEGQNAADIRNALALMVERRLHPSTLDSLIVEARLGPRKSGRPLSALDSDYEQLRKGA